MLVKVIISIWTKVIYAKTPMIFIVSNMRQITNEGYFFFIVSNMRQITNQVYFICFTITFDHINLALWPILIYKLFGHVCLQNKYGAHLLNSFDFMIILEKLFIVSNMRQITNEKIAKKYPSLVICLIFDTMRFLLNYGGYVQISFIFNHIWGVRNTVSTIKKF